jgi:branched-chain amino acid transport system ATP-binding protein
MIEWFHVGYLPNMDAGEKDENVLHIRGLSKSFGGLMVIRNLEFSLARGEILGVIGPNGSGKTTLFNMITGFLKPTSGEIKFLGRNVTNKKPSTICKSGISRTFQLVKPFPHLTALENVTAGRSYGRKPAESIEQAREEANEIMEFTGLTNKQMIVAERLNLGDRKRLEIARALATKPLVLLLDEVFAGLNPSEVEEALLLIQKIKDLGITLMVVEHVMKVILGVSNRVIVLSYGEKIFEGLPKEALNDKNVIEAYLGEDFRA